MERIKTVPSSGVLADSLELSVLSAHGEDGPITSVDFDFEDIDPETEAIYTQTAEEYIDSMIEADQALELLLDWRLMKPACLQYAVDAVITAEPSTITYVLNNLPQTITVGEEQLVRVAKELPKTLCDLVGNGKLQEVRSSIAVLNMLSRQAYNHVAMNLISEELLNTLSFADIHTVFDGGYLTADIVNKLVRAGRLSTEEEVDDLFNIVGRGNLMVYAKSLPTLIQSYIFKLVVTAPRVDMEYLYNIVHFDSLQEEDYIYLMDHIEDCLKEGISARAIISVFRKATGEAKTRFMTDVLPGLLVIEERNKQIEAMNEKRGTQRKLEKAYFEQGNIRLSTHGYEGEVSDSEIVHSLEHAHSVRTIGRFKDIANDPTRTNEITCVKTPFHRTTALLGADVNVEDCVIGTEHAALQELQTFLAEQKEKLPDVTLFDTLANDLSFVGEKEYAEAVKGIATYWKWFLDQDSENQLYIDTVLTGQNTRLKSDVYMFDRILEHFSDADMEKYWGQLLTKGADIIQDDPSKVKVVLLDDWTISGSQVQSTYTTFVGRHPALVSSVEVQLIAATAERIATGVENIRYQLNYDEMQAVNVPIVTRAYYIAHNADVEHSGAVGSRITGAHSSVDYGFASDLSRYKSEDDMMPLLANVVRNYRQTDYEPKNINRLKELYGIKK